MVCWNLNCECETFSGMHKLFASTLEKKMSDIAAAPVEDVAQPPPLTAAPRTRTRLLAKENRVTDVAAHVTALGFVNRVKTFTSDEKHTAVDLAKDFIAQKLFLQQGSSGRTAEGKAYTAYRCPSKAPSGILGNHPHLPVDANMAWLFPRQGVLGIVLRPLGHPLGEGAWRGMGVKI